MGNYSYLKPTATCIVQSPWSWARVSAVMFMMSLVIYKPVKPSSGYFSTEVLLILCDGFHWERSSSKECACQCRRHKWYRFNPWVGTIPWRRSWQPTLVFLPGESSGQRSLVGYSPQGHKELDMTEVTWHIHSRKVNYGDISADSWAIVYEDLSNIRHKQMV